MKFSKKELKERLGFKKEESDVIIKYQNELPLLAEAETDLEGCVIDARQLHNQLVQDAKNNQKGDKFSQWIKRRIDKYNFGLNDDYTFNWVDKNNTVHNFVNGESPQKLVSLGYKMKYLITLDMAKQLAMLENNELGRNARKYFIYVEKAFKRNIQWNKVRTPQREMYKILCKELDLYFQRNFNKRPNTFDYSNEANTLNEICLGARAKDILAYFEAKDKNTRDHLLAEYNLYLSKAEELDIMYLRMNMNKETRYNLIQQGFKALYPNASFVIANKTNRRREMVG